MQIPILIRRFALPVGAMLVVAACGSSAGAGWTYAPLGPSANPSAAASAPASGSPSGAPSGAPGSPSGSGGTGTQINIETTQDAPLVFAPADFTVPAGAQVTLNYMNNSNLPHNINVFAGADSNSESLGATEIATGPNAPETLTFTAPSQPGDYFFWCDVHTSAMQGIYHVQ